jgi:hypothetical protein
MDPGVFLDRFMDITAMRDMIVCKVTPYTWEERWMVPRTTQLQESFW